jgi:hypothetical protein
MEAVAVNWLADPSAVNDVTPLTAIEAIDV